MSASLYASVGRTARQLINKFGKRMLYRQKKDGQLYNDQTMRYEPSIKDTPFKGIRKNAKIEENPELPIQLGDCIILAAASGLPVPAINANSATVTLSQSSDILGVALEDAVEIILE